MKKIYIIILTIATLAGTGCKKFVDINHDPNRPTAVQEKLLLAPIEFNIANQVTAGPEGGVATYSNHYMQMVCYNQPIPNFGTYQMVSTSNNATWAAIYVTCLNNLKSLTTQSQANGNPNYTAIAEVLTAYCLGTATDWFGDIPYSKAFNGASGNFTPTYDKQEDIYKSIQALLDQAITDMGKNTGLKPGTDDFYYAGDMTKWKKAAYTLKARYYMHLINAPGYTPATQANLALTALQNGLAANTDDLQFNYPGASTSQAIWYVNMQPLSTLLASSAIVDTLVGRADPRLPLLIAPAKGTGLYTGRAIGTPTVGTYANYSLLGSFYAAVNAIEPILPYTEALFIKAEATLITSDAATAQPIYQAAITANMNKLGIAAGPQATYLAARGTLTTASALERIMQEKKIADYLSLENFNDWRRTGYPKLTLVPNATLTAIPRIFSYPQSEIDNNPQPQNKAARAQTDRVWWDTK
jgi:hypothetical protein